MKGSRLSMDELLGAHRKNRYGDVVGWLCPLAFGCGPQPTAIKPLVDAHGSFSSPLILASLFSTHGVYNLTPRAQRARSWKVRLGKRSFG